MRRRRPWSRPECAHCIVAEQFQFVIKTVVMTVLICVQKLFQTSEKQIGILFPRFQKTVGTNQTGDKGGFYCINDILVRLLTPPTRFSSFIGYGHERRRLCRNE